MAEIAVVNFSFEHERGIVLKGFRTVLVATGKSVNTSSIAIQWQFVHWKSKEIDLLDYVWDSRYHIWDVGEEPAPVLKTVDQARTFIG